MKRTLFALAFAAALPMSAQASELSYSFVEFDYANINVDAGAGSDFDADGFALRGSIGFGESNFYGFGSYADTTGDDFGFDTDITQTEIGLGYAHSLNDKADLVTELAWRNTDVDFGGFGSTDGDDYRLSVGFRGNLAENFEGSIKANYLDGDFYDGDFGATVGAQFKFNNMWGITGDVDFSEDVTTYTVGVRASF